MGLRCTVMGHDYGGSQQAEKREERGDEIVVTVREYRECRRCGHQKTLSENTEVRSGDTDDVDPSGETGETADSTSRPVQRDQEEPSGTAPDSTTDAAVDHGAIDATSEELAEGSDDGAAAIEDDGIILEDNTDDGATEDDPDDGRGPGEWPETAKENPETTPGEGGDSGTGGDWPTPDDEDQGYDAQPTAADSDDDVEYVSDLAEESGASATEEVDTDEDSTSQSDATSGVARDSAEPAARRPPPSETAVLSCPQCGHTRPSRASSLRPGDICPNCGDGYLAEREE